MLVQGRLERKKPHGYIGTASLGKRKETKKAGGDGQCQGWGQDVLMAASTKPRGPSSSCSFTGTKGKGFASFVHNNLFYSLCSYH